MSLLLAVSRATARKAPRHVQRRFHSAQRLVTSRGSTNHNSRFYQAFGRSSTRSLLFSQQQPLFGGGVSDDSTTTYNKNNSQRSFGVRSFSSSSTPNEHIASQEQVVVANSEVPAPAATDPLSYVLEAPDGTPLEPLTNVWPQDLLLQAMSYVHDASGLSWAAVIFLSTVTVRTLVLPVMLKTLQGTSRMALVKDDIAVLTAKSKDPSISDEERLKLAGQIRATYKRSGANPLVTLATPFISMPLFLSFFLATRQVRNYLACASSSIISLVRY